MGLEQSEGGKEWEPDNGGENVRGCLCDAGSQSTKGAPFQICTNVVRENRDLF